MKRYLDYRLGRSCEIPGGGVATIGVFDGVHIGHQAILRRTVQRAQDLGAPSTLVTFAVHPRLIVSGKAPKQLISLEQRTRLVESLGVNALLVMTFDERLRRIEAEPFVEEVFVKALGIRALVIGHDTAFGRDRRGDAALLETLGHKYGFDLDVVDAVFFDRRPVSSTRIRETLLAGDLPHAQAMLGRPVSLLGTVVPGDARGRELGYPTANIKLHHAAYPRAGVYAARGYINGRIQAWPAVCNIGRRPTFEDAENDIIELHLIDFKGDLYGRELRVEFIARLRDEQRFSNVQGLVAQIERDITRAGEILSQRR